MKYLFIALGLGIFPKGYSGGKGKGVCNHTHSVSTNSSYNYKIRTIWWRIYAYIESDAPYRNPFYMHFNEPPQCNRINVVKGTEMSSRLLFSCDEGTIGGPHCKSIEFDSNNNVKFKYLPPLEGIDCKEWSTINKFHTDHVNYIIMSGCENGRNDSHYIGLWVFIRARQYTKLRREWGGGQDELVEGPGQKVEFDIEIEIKQEIHRIIEREYKDIRHDIVYPLASMEPTSCGCGEELPFMFLNKSSRCLYERLDTCVSEKGEETIIDTIYSVIKYCIGFVLLFFVFFVFYFIILHVK